MPIKDLNSFLQEWDNASKTKRLKILQHFINTNNGKTAPELEQELCNGASLFFSRLTAWLRLSYMSFSHVKMQLKAILLFLTSSNGHKFLVEFVEVGGILTILEIIGMQQLDEVIKQESLKIIAAISITGRKYKELICESFGIRAVAECLARSKHMECQDTCKNVILDLAIGNPKYQNQVYKAMITLLKCSSPEAQQIAAQILQVIQPMIDKVSIGIIDPTLMLLQSLHLEVQYEGGQLVKLLIQHESVKPQFLNGLIGLLKPSKVDLQIQPEIINDPNVPNLSAPLPVFIQQAASAKLIGILVKDDRSIAEQLMKFDCVHGLLYAMGNGEYPDSQKQAGITLQYFIHNFEVVELKVRDAMGKTFFFEYMSNPDSFYLHATTIHMDILTGNKLKMK